MSGCPYISESKESLDSSSSSVDYTKKSSNVQNQTIEEILIDVIHKDFLLNDVDIDPFVSTFKTNMIHNGRLLKKLNPNLVEKLNLPLLLESAIVDIIQRDTVGYYHGSMNRLNSQYTENIAKMEQSNRQEILATQQSALLGLSPEMKSQLKECWSKLVNSKTGSLAKFFDEFYKNFLDMDKVGRKLFDGASMANQAQALMKILKFVMGSIDNPLNLLGPLQKMGVRHLIYGVEKKSFSAFGVSLAKTFQTILGPENVTSEMKEAWYVLIMKLGEVMMAEYDAAIKGWRGTLYCRTRSKGSQWKLRSTLLTHEKLVITRNHDTSKVVEEIYLNLIEDIDIVDEGMNLGGSGESSLYCLSISTAASVNYFKAANEADFDKWIEELTVRIRAHQRVNLLEDSESSEDSRKSPNKQRRSIKEQSQEKAIRDLKHGLQKKRRPSPLRTQMSQV